MGSDPSCVLLSLLRFIWQLSFAPKFLSLFELMLSVQVKSYDHVGTLPPFYGTYTQNYDVITSKNCFKYNHPTKPLRLICMSGFTLSLFLDRLRPEQLTSNQMPHSVSSFSCVPWDPKKVQVGNDREKAQSEKKCTSNTEVGKN